MVLESLGNTSKTTFCYSFYPSFIRQKKIFPRCYTDSVKLMLPQDVLFMTLFMHKLEPVANKP